MLAGFEANDCLQRQMLWFDLLRVFEGVLEVKGELGP
jgi:hypothetical protein